MAQPFRLPEIMSIARRDGAVRVEALALRFGVTVQTIRRDLALLAQTGELERVHGGAVLPSGTRNTPYEARRALAHDAKARIAAAAADRIPDGASLFVNIGTTTEAVARALCGHRGLLVVTNNLHVADILADTAEVIVTGGKLRAADGGLVGTLTSGTIRQFKFDMAVIGCSALDRDGDMLDFDVQEVEVSQAILAQARQILLVADATKFERNAPARIASLAAVDLLITDDAPPDRVARRCVQWETEVIVVSGSKVLAKTFDNFLGQENSP